MAETYHYLQLRRLSDDLVYEFDKRPYEGGASGYRRRDNEDVWVIYKPDHGWVVIDHHSGTISGRPWDVLVKDQGDFPPEGEWISKKGAKSYVYQLVYGNNNE